jgi:signal transduction histidine kinase
VFITSLVTDKSKFLLDSANVSSGNLRYVFNYTALSYLSPAKIKFKYMLEGVDPMWVDVGTARQAEYTNLKPGSYSFRVMACNNDGLWNEQGATFYLTVDPFFYQTWWFYSISILFVLIIFHITYKWRVFRVEQRNAELNKLNSELDRFVYSTSHDLRAPLASILGLVNLSRLEAKNKDEYINLIEKSVKKLDEFISEIIDYSRNSRLDLEPDVINFEVLANSAIEDLAYLDNENKLEKTVSVNGSASFYSDKTRIGIILNNLLSNAIKYYNPNEPTPAVNISITHTDKHATIRVTDNGIGIKDEHQENIFKMFFRGSERSKGSGLGLYIVKETVEKLGGTITVQSKISKGSTFEVVLPSLVKKS